MLTDQSSWPARQAAHEARIDEWIVPHLQRRRRGEKHPVLDFLFTYYSFRPAQLRHWRPGGDPHKRPSTVEWVRDLLTATAARPPHLGCFGLHEWAMVYRQTQDELRHNAWPLRLGPHGTDALVEASRIRCSHFDAFRFYTAPARSLNLLQPTRETQTANEQPGCLHANMDLYKWSYKLSPLTPSELVADCFELAVAIRTLDMQASPYDLAPLGYPPVPIETPDGRAEYTRRQRDLSDRAAPLRAALITACDTTPEAKTQRPKPSHDVEPDVAVDRP